MLIPRTKKTKVGTDLVKVEVFFPRRIMTKLVAHVHIGDNCWGLRFTNEHHIRFARRPVTLFDIALPARTHNIIPRCHTTSRPGNNMVNSQQVLGILLACILTGILITHKNISSREFHHNVRDSYISNETNNKRNLNRCSNRSNLPI